MTFVFNIKHTKFKTKIARNQDNFIDITKIFSTLYFVFLKFKVVLDSFV